MRKRLLPVMILAGSVAQSVLASTPAATGKTAKGLALIDTRGMTLYTFDRDSAGRSACTGPCAANWLPLAAPAGAAPSGSWSVLTRDDGSKQWAYRDKPLYTWTKDIKPGDITGDGFLDGAWHMAQP